MGTYLEDQKVRQFERINFPTHYIDSGMGGYFKVRLLEKLEGRAKIRYVDKYLLGTESYLKELFVAPERLVAI